MIIINYTRRVNSKFAVLGDTINMASRVESLTRTHNVDLLITEVVKKKLDDRYALMEMKPMPVKGKENPITTYFVEGMKSN